MIFRHNQAKPRPRIKGKFTVMVNQCGDRNRRHEDDTANRRSFNFILFVYIGISSKFFLISFFMVTFIARLPFSTGDISYAIIIFKPCLRYVT